MAGDAPWMGVDKPGKGEQWILTITEDAACFDSYGYENNAAKKARRAEKFKKLRSWFVLNLVGVIVVVNFTCSQVRRRRSRRQKVEEKEAQIPNATSFHRIT